MQILVIPNTKTAPKTLHAVIIDYCMILPIIWQPYSIRWSKSANPGHSSLELVPGPERTSCHINLLQKVTKRYLAMRGKAQCFIHLAYTRLPPLFTKNI